MSSPTQSATAGAGSRTLREDPETIVDSGSPPEADQPQAESPE